MKLDLSVIIIIKVVIENETEMLIANDLKQKSIKEKIRRIQCAL